MESKKGMVVMRVTSKGQVTIPKHIRDRVGMLPETEVEFRLIEGQVVLLKAKSKSKRPTRGAQLVQRLQGKGDVNLTTDEIMALTRDGYNPDEAAL